MAKFTRREVLKFGVAGGAGAVVAVAGGETLHAGAAIDSPRHTRSSTVIRERDPQHVVVTVLTATGARTAVARRSGFPDGWQCEPGDVVAVHTDDDGGLTAFPLTNAVSGRLTELSSSSAVVDGQRLAVRSGSFISVASSDVGADRSPTAFVVENDFDGGPAVVALLPERHHY